MDQVVATAWEIHVRPMILPLIDGKPDCDNAWEVDLWFSVRPGIKRVLREYICDNQTLVQPLIDELRKEFPTATVVNEK